MPLVYASDSKHVNESKASDSARRGRGRGTSNFKLINIICLSITVNLLLNNSTAECEYRRIKSQYEIPIQSTSDATQHVPTLYVHDSALAGATAPTIRPGLRNQRLIVSTIQPKPLQPTAVIDQREMPIDLFLSFSH